MNDVLMVGFHLGRGEAPRSGPSAVAQWLFERSLCDNWQQSDSLTLATVTLDNYAPSGPVLSRPPQRTLGTWSINLPLIREGMLAFSALGLALNWALTARHPRAMIATFHYMPVSLPLLAACRLTKTPLITIFTDLPLFSYSPQRVREMPAWKRPLITQYRKLSELLAKSSDAYILFSQPMNDLVNPKNRPFVVIEGMFSGAVDDHEDREPTSREQVLAHAGTLDREYGVDLILSSFRELAAPDAELWFFGRGDMDSEITHAAVDDPRIVHHGFIPRTELFKKLRQATLLLNFRDPRDDYTKYSFPSKMFEYLATGTPVVTTRLQGIPDEYFDHVYAIDHGSPQKIAQQIKDLLEKPVAELRARGARAKDFVLTEKTAARQTQRISEFVSNFLTEGKK